MRRPRHVACLSMPDNLHALARDLSDLERRLAGAPAERRPPPRRSRSAGRLVVTGGAADGDRDAADEGGDDGDDDGYYLGALNDDEEGGAQHGRQDLGSRGPSRASSSTWADIFDGPSETDEFDGDADAIGLCLSERAGASDPAGGVEPRPSRPLEEGADSPLEGSQTLEDPSRMASACLRELLSIVGVDELLDDRPLPKVHDPTAVDSKSPCSVLSYHPNAVPPAKERNSADDVPGKRFALLSPERRANSLPTRKPPRWAPPAPVPRGGAMPRKSSMRNLSSAALGAVAPSSSENLKRTVSFHELQIREYSIELSDHPSCSCGPPIQLGWDYRDRATVQLDEYEERRRPRRRSEELVLSYHARRYLLLKRAGYSAQELRRVVEEVNKVKRERLLTDLFSPMMKFDETMEEIMDQVKATFSIRKKRELRGELIL